MTYEDDLADRLLALPPDELADVIAKSQAIGAGIEPPAPLSMAPLHDQGALMREARDALEKLGGEIEGMSKRFSVAPNESAASARQLVAKIDDWLRQPMPLPSELMRTHSGGATVVPFKHRRHDGEA